MKPLINTPIPHWVDRAVCASVDPELFHPENGVNIGPAKRICGGCEVRAQCLAEALADPTLSGVWGGTSQRERTRLRGIPDGHRACRGCGIAIPNTRGLPMRCEDCRDARVVA